MAIHIKDINDAVRIIRDTQIILKKMDKIIEVSKLKRISQRIDNFMEIYPNETSMRLKKEAQSYRNKQ